MLVFLLLDSWKIAFGYFYFAKSAFSIKKWIPSQLKIKH